MTTLPFDNSRRLLGANVFFVSTGAVLDVTRAALDADLITAWRIRVTRATEKFPWGPAHSLARPHRGGTQLAIAAPAEQLYLATEISEWALCASLLAADPLRWADLEQALRTEFTDNGAADSPAAGLPPVLREAEAFERFARIAALEADPKLICLLEAAAARCLPALLDDQLLTLGSGTAGRDFSIEALPDETAVAWDELGDIPTAIVTGSNGKTTTVRVLAACARAAGWRTGYNCTDGVYLDFEQRVSGDYSGPAGARLVLREKRAEAAILETARGGILRRGLAVAQASAAIVTNVSADHFGEYGIDDLSGLAHTKLTVAAAVRRQGLLVLNADDANIRLQAQALKERLGFQPRLGWFSATPDSTHLKACSALGQRTCGVKDGNLVIEDGGLAHDLGSVASMPLTIDGIATYNVANLAGAALVALALGIMPATVAQVFARFGRETQDNPGRMMRFERGGVTVLVDYAHNPDGLRGLLEVANHLRSAEHRLGLILGQAGNRLDADIEQLVLVAASCHPDLVVIKENETQLRGRAPGEMPQLLRSGLMRQGLPESMLPMEKSEVEAALHALAWAEAGDVIVLPMHIASARHALLARLTS